MFHEGVEGIVISRQKDYQSPTVRVAHSIEEAFQLAEQNRVQKIYSGSQKSEVWGQVLCPCPRRPMPYALCPLLAPHVSEKGYIFSVDVKFISKQLLQPID